MVKGTSISVSIAHLIRKHALGYAASRIATIKGVPRCYSVRREVYMQNYPSGNFHSDLLVARQGFIYFL
jgi:hypothetical protein